MPDTVLHIRPGAFTNAACLSQLYVPATVKTFGACESVPLGEIDYGGTAAQWQTLADASSMDLSGIPVVYEADAASVSGVAVDIRANDTNYEVPYTAPGTGIYGITAIDPNGSKSPFCTDYYFGFS